MPIVYFFKDWLFSRFPDIYTNQDTYIDSNGEGLFKRYLRNFGMELDENIKSYIDNFVTLFDPMQCPTTLLPALSFILGEPISVDNTEATFRKLLKYAVRLYKVKGTIVSYQMLFNLIGLEIAIIEDVPGKPLTYDDDPIVIYDDPTGIKLYDTGCDNCSGYSIAYNASNEPLNIAAVDSAILAIATSIIPFIQPINAKLDGFIKRLNISEVMPINITEESSLDNFLPPTGEFGINFDNINEFD